MSTIHSKLQAHSFSSERPQSYQKSSLDFKASDTDTINSLERDLEIASMNIPHVSKGDIEEMKTFNNPPVVIILVLEANSILFTRNVQPSHSRFSKTVRDFQSFDKDRIPYSVLEKLEPYIDHTELNSDRIKCVSASAVGVMEWIRSIYQYGIITHKLKQLGVNPKQKPAQQTHSKDLQSFSPLIPPAKKKISSLNIEVSDTDTINSLERDLEIANKNIPHVSKGDIEEMKTFNKPPIVIKYVRDANSILFTRNVQPYTPRFSKTVRYFQSFDKDSIPYSVLEKLEPYIDNPELNSDRIKCVSASAVGVMEWIRSIYQYGIITHKLKQLGVNPKQKPAQQTYSKDSQSFPPLIPPAKKKISSLNIEVSDTDTINSLGRDLEIANKNIPQVSKGDIEEMKTFNKPPAVVKYVRDANSILFTRNVQPYTPRFSKTVRDFQSFDKDRIPYSVLEKLEPYIDNPELNSDRIKCVSASAVGLMEWIRSIYQYGIITHKLKQLNANAEQRDTTSEMVPSN